MLGTLAAGLASAGCASDPSGRPAAVVSDSAGIRIVMNREPRWSEDSRWRLPDEPTLIIGEALGPPEYAFSQLFEIAAFTDGRLALYDFLYPDIRIFDRSGRYIETWGGGGDGPGGTAHMVREVQDRGGRVIVIDPATLASDSPDAGD